MSRNPYKAYQQTQVTTAKPEKILLMLYEGAIKFNKISIQKMNDIHKMKADSAESPMTSGPTGDGSTRRELMSKAISSKGTHVSKTMAIISELMNTLDHDVGGQLAQDLENLYMFMMDKLIEANIQNKVEPLVAVERLLMTLYQGWVDVVNNPRADGIPSQSLQPELFQVFNAAKKAG
jgi:flagellar secretion chaperone FliS